MKIDLHVHTSERSGCSVATEEQMILAAMGVGLDAIVITDHDRLVPLERLRELNELFSPFRVFGGIEVTLPHDEHVSIIGVHDPALECGSWTYEKLHAFIREEDAYICLNHPYRFRNELNVNVDNLPPDAMELRSSNINPELEERIEALIHRVDCRAVCASDAHDIDAIGLHHIDLKGEPRDERELATLLRAGAFTCAEREECFELVDEQGRRIGMARRSDCHGDPDLMHPVVHVMVFDSAGRLFLQKRRDDRDIQPGMWDTSVGGHLRPGEKPRWGAVREMKEELGAMPDDVRLLYEYVWKSDVETELVRTYMTVYDGPFDLQKEELADGRFWTLDEIREALGTGVLSTNFEEEFRRLKENGVI
jgi:isopentenyldiphosphate isomerase/predicted metal-dependent phosphoesterase TrpH